MTVQYTTLVDAQTLARHLDDPGWKTFDCRHDLARPEAGSESYRAGHIPGAGFLHLDHDLSAPVSGHNGRHPLPDATKLIALLAARGVGNDMQVVAYDDSGGAFAVRLWWLLRWLGHESVAVLDGGWSAWRRQALPTTDALPSPVATGFAGQPGGGTVDAGRVEENIAAQEFLLLDARSGDRFRGENETLDPVAGHIPGAVNRFFRQNLRDDGHFKPADLLRDEYRTLLGAWAAPDVVHYCGSGVTACHNQLAMQIAGLTGSRIYPGSWSEWCADSARPVASGN